MFYNLISEMERCKPKITIPDIAGCLHVSEEKAKNYLEGTESITWFETLKIKYTYFPDLELDYLFETEGSGAQKVC